MIIEKEISATKLSPTKKDFYQIWNELLDTASKLSDRWDPTSTNEADPGIVLLKVLTACADKLNYSIDKNILEAFMPSVTQEENMRKLCEMLGYNIKYYQSAQTDVTVSYVGITEGKEGEIFIPRFTPIKSEEEDIIYSTLKDRSLRFSDGTTLADLTAKIPCIEGSIIVCPTDNENNIITINNIDSYNRFYLPEATIAENGIFIWNADTPQSLWQKVDNLNTQLLSSRVWKLGYDSTRLIPYIQFPDDIAELIDDGLQLVYTRTTGINGNISARVLTKIDTTNIRLVPPSASVPSPTTVTENTFKEADFAVVNLSAAMNGANIESINDAYENYKRTIGTFDTLITCRDYINKIYSLYNEDNIPLVSNVIVSDIRDDINRATTLCSFNDHGICYIDTPLSSDGKALINNFDLVIYPFKTVYGFNTKSEYEKSFTYSEENQLDIEAALAKNKTISHVFNYPKTNEIVCIKNYLKLDAKITTTYKVNAIEEASILANIKKALYTNFNMRKISFGEEIPYDSILSCIETADTRIKNVSLAEPVLYTRFLCKDAPEEYDLASALKDKNTDINAYNTYIKLAVRNIIAGRVKLFNYDESFKYELVEQQYNDNTKFIYPDSSNTIKNLTSTCEINSAATNADRKYKFENIKLLKNEVLSFRAPNYRTTLTYPGYVNYYFSSTTPSTTIISANSDYKLKDNDKLYINYTEADENGATTNVIYKVYDASQGIVIRPNFELKDSSTVVSDGVSFSKIISDTSKWPATDTLKPAKLFTLDSTQQIEIREPAQVTLNNAVTYVYWTLNKSIHSDDSEFPFNNNGEYILADNEYFYYTDINKLNMAYYGAGTKIKRSKDAIKLTKQAQETEVTAENIFDLGISSIPWVKINLDFANYITLTEYQYINLTANDQLVSLTSQGNTIDNTWRSVEEVEYKLYSDPDTTKTLPGIADGNWECRSRLDFNVGPTLAQTLYQEQGGKQGENNTWTKTDKIKIKIVDSSGSGSNIDLAPNTTNGPLTIKTNYSCVAAEDTISTEITKINSDGSSEAINDFKVLVYKNNELQLVDIAKPTTTIAVPFGMLGEYWKTISLASFENNKTNTKYKLPLYITVPDTNHYALLMVYYITTKTEKEKLAYITYTQSSSAPVIINNIVGKAESWWADYTCTNSKLYLRPGLNIIKFTKSDTITLFANSDTTGNIILGNLDLVSASTTDKGINLTELGLAGISAAADDVLAAINTIDPGHNFYYNCLLDSGSAIDLNVNSSSGEESLASPRAWYNYNNLNNKFVISEIDASYLSSGITIAKSSKR